METRLYALYSGDSVLNCRYLGTVDATPEEVAEQVEKVGPTVHAEIHKQEVIAVYPKPF